jgi:hypothetical protein
MPPCTGCGKTYKKLDLHKEACAPYLAALHDGLSSSYDMELAAATRPGPHKLPRASECIVDISSARQVYDRSIPSQPPGLDTLQFESPVHSFPLNPQLDIPFPSSSSLNLKSRNDRLRRLQSSEKEQSTPPYQPVSLPPTRSGRMHWQPRVFADYLPTEDSGVPEYPGDDFDGETAASQPIAAQEHALPPLTGDEFDTKQDAFGVS